MPVAKVPSGLPPDTRADATLDSEPSRPIFEMRLVKPRHVSLVRQVLPALPAPATYTVPSGAIARPRGLFRPLATTVVAACAGPTSARPARPVAARVVRSFKCSSFGSGVGSGARLGTRRRRRIVRENDMRA